MMDEQIKNSKGWVLAPLGDVCEILDSLRVPVNSDERDKRIVNKSASGLYPYYGATGQVGIIDGYLFEGEHILLGEDGAPFLEPFRDKAYIADGKFWVNNHAHILRSKISNKYLCYYLNQLDYSDHVTGTTRLKLTQAALKTIPIKFAPANEQKRIVAKIEELFSELDNATKCLLAAKAQQKIFYQSVLDNAFSNCKEHRKLEDLLSQKLSNGYSGKPVSYETNYRVLSLSSTTSGVFLDSHFKFLDEPTLEDRDIWCTPNDILIQRGNTIEYVGVPAIFTGMPRRFIFPDLMIRVRANKNLISTKFLYYALSSPKIRNYLRQKAKGSAGTMPKINQSILASLPIPFCSKETQKKIVEDIEEKLSNGLAIERTIEESLSKSKILRQSILKKAFSGKLVTQDPNDEPASVLLERIRAEKEAQKTESKNPKTKRNAA